MTTDDDQLLSRRVFLQAGLTAAALSACSPADKTGTQDPTATAEQLAKRIQGVSPVAIVACPSYAHNPLPDIKKHLSELALSNLKGKRVLIKPNMVEYRDGRPLTTNPAILKTAVELVNYLGAKEIIVADGPAEFRDTEFLLAATGIGSMCKILGVPFVDLNLDSLMEVENPHGFTPLKSIWMSETVMKSDCVVSLPKLKTHQWAGMTCCLKNLFGTIPGRKYGWPKNIIHTVGIDIFIIDIAHMVKPAFALVDAVVSMEGNGPLSGNPKATGFLVLAKDLAAADATCARAMEFDPTLMLYMRLAGQVIGNIESSQIKILGTPLTEVTQKFVMPDTWKSGKLDISGAHAGT